MAEKKQTEIMSLVPKKVWTILGTVALVPILVYVIIACGGWLNSSEWANAGTFISCFAVISLTALNIYAMFSINATLQSNQQNQYQETRTLEMFKAKMQIMNEVMDAYRKVHEELGKGNLNTEVVIAQMTKLYQLNKIITNTDALFPSLKASQDVSRFNDLLAGFGNALAGVYVPINPQTHKAYTPQELLKDIELYFDFVMNGISADISEEMKNNSNQS